LTSLLLRRWIVTRRYVVPGSAPSAMARGVTP
jgi:hypothetical protein